MSAAYAKPRGALHVNRADPFGRLMTAGWLFNGPTMTPAGKICVPDICGGSGVNSPNSLVPSTVVSAPFSFVNSIYGTVLNRIDDNTTDRLLFNSGGGVTIDINTPFAIVFRAMTRSSAGYQVVLTQGSGTGLFLSNNKLNFYKGIDQKGATVLPTNSFFSAALIYDGTNINYFYFDPSDGFTADANNGTYTSLSVPFTPNNLLSDPGSEHVNGQWDYLYYFYGSKIPQKQLELLMADPYRVVRRRSIIYLKHSASGTTYNDSISLATASAIAGSMSDVMALANNMATNAAIVETAKLIVNTALSYAVSTLTTPLLVSQINLTVASGIQAGINGSTQQIMQVMSGLGVQASDVEMLGKVFNISVSLAVQAALADLLTTGSQYNPGIIRMILESFRIPTLTNESFKLPSIINETFLGPS